MNHGIATYGLALLTLHWLDVIVIAFCVSDHIIEARCIRGQYKVVMVFHPS